MSVPSKPSLVIQELLIGIRIHSVLDSMGKDIPIGRDGFEIQRDSSVFCFLLFCFDSMSQIEDTLWSQSAVVLMHNVAEGWVRFPYLNVSVFLFRSKPGKRKSGTLCVKREERSHRYFYVFDNFCEVQLYPDFLVELTIAW